MLNTCLPQGQFSRLIHQIFNRARSAPDARAKIVAFEPIEQNREAFARWIAGDGLAGDGDLWNLTDIQPYALGNENGQFELFVSGAKGTVGALGASPVLSHSLGNSRHALDNGLDACGDCAMHSFVQAQSR